MSPFALRRLSDEALGRRLAGGEAPAFDELYRRYVHRLAAFGTHLLGDGATGDDVAQVALIRAYQALRRGVEPASIRPWFFRIAHNVAIDIVRSRREIPSALMSEGRWDDGYEAGALLSAIAALPERQRQVFVLRELHGLRIDEAAAEIGLTVAQVEQALFAARNRMAEQLVFGERLGCLAVRRLAAGPLDQRERRALKTHLRSCGACRQELGSRSIKLTAGLDWLRLVTGGGAPLAAKLGAVAIATTVAASTPLSVNVHARTIATASAARTRKHLVHHVLGRSLVQGITAATTQHAGAVTVAMRRAAPFFSGRVVEHVTEHETEPAPTASADGSRDGTTTATAPEPADTSGDTGITSTTSSGDASAGSSTTPSPTTTSSEGDHQTTTTTTTTTTSNSDGSSNPETSTDGSGDTSQTTSSDSSAVDTTGGGN